MRRVCEGKWIKFEIGRILHLKSEIRNCKLDWSNLKFRISDLRCRIRPISNFFKTVYFGNPGPQGNGWERPGYAGCRFASASIYSTALYSRYSAGARLSCGSSWSLPVHVRQVPFLP